MRLAKLYPFLLKHYSAWWKYASTATFILVTLSYCFAQDLYSGHTECQRTSVTGQSMRFVLLEMIFQHPVGCCSGHAYMPHVMFHVPTTCLWTKCCLIAQNSHLHLLLIQAHSLLQDLQNT